MRAGGSARTNAQWTQATTRRLLEFAREEFAAQGYDGASVDRIAERAGLTKGAVYYHFGSKPGFFRAVFEQTEIELVERIEARALSFEDPLEGVIRGCEVFVDVAADPEFSRIILIDGPRVLGIETWREIDAKHGLRSLREGIEVCIQMKRLKPLDAGALSLLLSGAMNEAVLSMSPSGMNEPHRRTIHATLRAILEGLAMG